MKQLNSYELEKEKRQTTWIKGRKHHKYKIMNNCETVKVWTMKGEVFFIDLEDLYIIKKHTYSTDKNNYLYAGDADKTFQPRENILTWDILQIKKRLRRKEKQ